MFFEKEKDCFWGYYEGCWGIFLYVETLGGGENFFTTKFWSSYDLVYIC